MEDPETKRTLLHSIETRRRELLWSEERRVSALKKGKSPKTQQDSEREDKLAKALKDLADDYKYISESESTEQRQKFAGLQPNVRSSVSRHHHSGAARLFAVQSTNTPSPPVHQQPIADEPLWDEPLWNPFTSSYAYRETGFEPGPSNSKHQTLPEVIEEEAVDGFGRFGATVSAPGVLDHVIIIAMLMFSFSRQIQHSHKKALRSTSLLGYNLNLTAHQLSTPYTTTRIAPHQRYRRVHAQHGHYLIYLSGRCSKGKRNPLSVNNRHTYNQSSQTRLL